MSIHSPDFPKIDATELHIAVVAARYNGELVNALLRRTLETLKSAKVSPRNVELRRVPGSNELPYVCNMLAASGQFDAVIALGVIIAGETMHDKLIAQTASMALANVGFSTEVPVVNGILAVENEEQAKARITGSYDRGAEFARCAVEMARHKIELVERLDALEDEAENDGDIDPENFFKNN